MQAIILAGGKGTRLHPYTKNIPKPLLPVGDYPIIEIIIKQLSKHGFNSIILAVGHMHHLFNAFFEENEKKYGLDISFSIEDKPLGTAGVLSNCIDSVQDDFLLMNGDILTTLDYNAFFKHHAEMQNDFTIAVHERNVDIDYGVLEFDDQNILKKYNEKPKFTYEVSMGIYMLRKKSVINYINVNEYLDVPDLVKKMQDDDKKIHRYKEKCDWLDIGRPDDYEKATNLFNSQKSKYLND